MRLTSYSLDTVTGVPPTMGTLGLGLGTVGLPDSQGLSADMYNTLFPGLPWSRYQR